MLRKVMPNGQRRKLTKDFRSAAGSSAGAELDGLDEKQQRGRRVAQAA
jgi:hypothetical protein